MKGHKLIIHGILREIEIKDNSEIPDVISRMTETVEYVDRWMNINGANRTTPWRRKNDALSQWWIVSYDQQLF